LSEALGVVEVLFIWLPQNLASVKELFPWLPENLAACERRFESSLFQPV